MSLSRQPRNRPLLVGLALGLAIGTGGCSGQSGAQVQVQEADQQVLQKSAEAYKKRMQEKAKLPRSKQNAFD